MGGTEVSRQERVMAGAYLSRRRQGSGETTHGVYPNPLIKKANPRGQTTSSGMHWEFQVFPQGSQQPTRLRGAPNNSSATDDCSQDPEKRGHPQFIPQGPVPFETRI